MNSFIFTYKDVHRANEFKIHHSDPHNKKVYNVKQKSGKFLSLIICLQKCLLFRDVQEKYTRLLKVELLTLYTLQLFQSSCFEQG